MIHFILLQVYVYKKSTYDEIKHRLRSVGISNMSPAELGTYFGPWHAQHIGKIKVASGNKTVESWAAKNLRVQYYFFTYPSLLKIHDSVNLMTILNDILKNEALVELEMRALTPAFKDPAKRKWFEEVLTNFLHLYETNLWWDDVSPLPVDVISVCDTKKIAYQWTQNEQTKKC